MDKTHTIEVDQQLANNEDIQLKTPYVKPKLICLDASETEGDPVPGFNDGASQDDNS